MQCSCAHGDYLNQLVLSQLVKSSGNVRVKLGQDGPQDLSRGEGSRLLRPQKARVARAFADSGGKAPDGSEIGEWCHANREAVRGRDGRDRFFGSTEGGLSVDRIVQNTCFCVLLFY
jgi:hypothetical protein